MSNNDTCAPGTGGYPSDCDITQGLLKKASTRHQEDERGYVWKSCFPKAKEIVLLLLDVDGVLTDGTIYFTHEGTETKGFNTQDGFGIRLLKKIGVDVGLITARSSEAVRKRAENLGLQHVYQGVDNKITAYEQLLTELDIDSSKVAYVGDDWLDFPLLRRVGFSVAVANGVHEVKHLADYVTRKTGGHGAVREVCDLIIDAKGMQEKLLEEFLNR